MRTLVLVKHAPPRIEPTAPAPTWPLSEEGRALCRPLADALVRHRPAFVVASREAKAAETALHVARRLGVPWSVAEGLGEHDRRGVPYYPARGEFVARMRELFRRPSERVLGAESADRAHARFEAALASALGERPVGNAVVVTHATVLALFAGRALDLDPYDLWCRMAYPAYVAIEVPNMRLVETWNLTEPLEE